jgi:hypothetical protein
MRYPEAFDGPAFGGAAAISAEGDAEGAVLAGVGTEQMKSTINVVRKQGEKKS